ncbi:hypothetical protein ACTNDG_01480 [Clostridium sp. HCP1S3_B4]|uniref:hypothetical protein n=1 Tax=unclassified Clostridium TaxID=2614128 RepID=UPI002A770296|nr:hypothetical protein [Clostridiales bacterium]MDY2729410.1 hypothetical protein [Clostridium sp.]
MKSEDDFKLITGLVVTGVILACSIYIIYYNINVCKKPYVISIIFALIPLAIALFKFLKLYKDTTGNYKFLNIWLVVFSLFFFGSSIVSFKALNKVTNVTDYNAYEKVIRYEKYPSNKKIAHFPSTIPADVDNKEFKEWGTVGSDDAGMILSYSVSNNEINTEEFKEKIQSAKYKASSKIGLEEVSQKLYIPQIVYDTLGLNDEGNINNDFSTYILDASDQESINSKSDYSYGIIVDNKNSKITYYSVTAKK